ncbi:MAG: hypothetical protein CVU11_12600 [Bacteroidetes bacterium HGW-Bacteroidetes-6]|jgi:hypothetical protein|nr:MAG: hypothetical protein CVU11_12600 [Bacteroidetes bacterium HGW-Bacteroidetes-6]
MKKTLITAFILCSLFSINVSAQTTSSGESYGKTLNVGLGIGGYYGYYSYVGQTMPVFHLDYEFDVANNFTLAPFVTFYSYRNRDYRETVIPIGGKGTYYFDQILNANSNWDFYLAGSLGFAIVNVAWDSDYYGDHDYYNRGNPMFFDFHIGTEYHFNSRLGIFLDLSTGVSTIGLAIH